MIEKSETNSKRGPFFMFLGRKLRNRRQISSEDLSFIFLVHQIVAAEIKFCSPKWVVKLPWVRKWAWV